MRTGGSYGGEALARLCIHIFFLFCLFLRRFFFISCSESMSDLRRAEGGRGAGIASEITGGVVVFVFFPNRPLLTCFFLVSSSFLRAGPGRAGQAKGGRPAERASAMRRRPAGRPLAEDGRASRTCARHHPCPRTHRRLAPLCPPHASVSCYRRSVSEVVDVAGTVGSERHRRCMSDGYTVSIALESRR